MPIFEYKCEECGKLFEAIVMGSRQPECPACNSQKLEKQLSSFAVSGGNSSSSSAPCGAPSGSCGPRGGG